MHGCDRPLAMTLDPFHQVSISSVFHIEASVKTPRVIKLSSCRQLAILYIAFTSNTSQHGHAHNKKRGGCTRPTGNASRLVSLSVDQKAGDFYLTSTYPSQSADGQRD